MADKSSPDDKASGAYFTPLPVVEALVSWAVRSERERLIDPSCGDGRFVACHRNSVGIEQNPASAGAAVAAAPWALIHEGDFFQWATETCERFECAAGNPPFIRYQLFKGPVRERALRLCAAQGVKFSGLASSWAPFLVATAGLLMPGGRMAFVVPAEIGHAPYAAPLLEYLAGAFSAVEIVAVRDKLFPGLSEDCWLLFADGFGGRASHIGFTRQDRFEWTSRPPKPTERIDLSEWRTQWARRLRPYLLSPAMRRSYLETADRGDSARLADFADVGIGYVSGDNSFFHLRPSEAAALGIEPQFLQPTVRRGSALPSNRITSHTVAQWRAADEPALLLRLKRAQQLSLSVRRYLDGEAGQSARMGYKCRSREPWFAVPDVQIPDFMLSYMSGRTPHLVANEAKVTCTNAVHAVRVRDSGRAKTAFKSWGSAFVELSCEIEGHALGGGMLKVEPREAGRILFPSGDALAGLKSRELTEGVRTMRAWRHYAH